MENQMRGVSVVIPCLNEEKTIVQVIEDAKKYLPSVCSENEIIVVDNGSTDNSRNLATQHGARVISLEEKGYGRALHTGIMAAKYEYVIFGDADCSYPFENIGRLVSPLMDNKSDFVLGNRLKGKIESRAMPYLNRWVGTPILSFIIRLLHKLPTWDCNSGMRAFKKSVYPSLKMLSPGMEFASEMLIKVAAEKSIRYSEIPISFKKDARDRAPHLKRWRDGWRHLRYIVSFAPTKTVVVVPGILIAVAYLAAFLISFNSGPIRYHSAFILIALATPLLFFIISVFLIKCLYFHFKGMGSRLVQIAFFINESAIAFGSASFLLLLLALESVVLFKEWYDLGFGALAEPSSLIRISIYGILASALLCLDMVIGLIRVIPQSKETTKS